MTINVITQVLTGTGSEEVEVSTQYNRNQISILGVTTGKVTIKVKPYTATTYENLINGTLNVEFDKTLQTEGQASSFQFQINTEVAYTVKIKQTDANTER